MTRIPVICRAAAMTLFAFLPLTASAAPSEALKPVCDMLCGDWGPPRPSADEAQRELHLAWDEAASEIRGTQVLTGWPGAADSEVKIVIRHDPAQGIAYVVGDGTASLISTVFVEGDAIRIIGLVPGKPDLSAVTIFTAPGRDRLHEVQAESGQQYNMVHFETDYVRRTK